MKITPEGFLICYNVPIARTGKQEYLGEEIGITDEPDKLFVVIRKEGEVFSPATMASFEGKPVTNEHPDDDVVPDNYNNYSVGHATNIRRGDGKYSDTIMADLLICEKQAIEDVLNGKREISCGYGCNYEFDDAGNIFQTNIRGNHIAIVEQGRAGPKVSIKDKKPEKKQSERRFKPMAKRKRKQGIIAQILGMTANDVDPEALAEVIETVAELEAGDEDPTTDNDPAQDNEQASDNETQDTGVTLDSETATKLVDSINALSDHVGALLQKEALSPLDELEDELSEESVTKPVEEIDEDTTDEEAEDEAAEDEEAEDNEAEDSDTEDEDAEDSDTVSSNDSLLRVIRAVKPHIAKIPNPKDRKKASDSLAKAIRQIKGKPAPKKKNGYKTVLDAKTKTAKSKARDKAASVVNFDERQNVYDTLNPHKGGKK